MACGTATENTHAASFLCLRVNGADGSGDRTDTSADLVAEAALKLLRESPAR
jgi:hypothetical protein